MTPEEIATILAQHAEWLRDPSKGARANLSRADLSRADLRGADLSRADLRGADLRGADLSGADLRGADLRGADLSRADLRRADLRWADLSDADLSRADLSDADLRGANLRGADIDYAAWPLWCGALNVTLDERQQAQLLYHVLAVCPVARKLATPEMLEFVNSSHVVQEHGCPQLRPRSE